MAALRTVIAIVVALLLVACSTARMLDRVRAAPAGEGLHVYLAATSSEVCRGLPGMLETLGYSEISVEPTVAGHQVLAADKGDWDAFGHGLRLIVEPSSDPKRGATQVRLTLRKRIDANIPEDIDAARDQVALTLRTRFGAPP